MRSHFLAGMTVSALSMAAAGMEAKAQVTMMTSNANGQSWETASAWSDNQPADSGADYSVGAAFVLRTPQAAATFPGDSLTLAGQLNLVAGGGSTTSINNLTLASGGVIVNAIGDSTQTLAGGLHVDVGGTGFIKSTGTTDSSGNTRNIIVDSLISGGTGATLHFLRKGTFTVGNAANTFGGTWRVGGTGVVVSGGGGQTVGNNANNISILSATNAGSLGVNAGVVLDLWSRFQVGYDWATTGALTLMNNAGFGDSVVMTLNRTFAVGALAVAGDSPLLAGTYTYADLATLGYGAYFTNDGGSIVVAGGDGGGPDPDPVNPPPPFVGAGPALRLIRDTAVSGSGWNFDTGAFGTSINGQTFQQEGLVSFNGWQYTAYFDATRRPALGRRQLPDGPWETIVFTDYAASNHKDNHNVNVVGVCPADGTIHLSYDHHNSTLHYRRSVPGLATNPENFAWTQSGFGGTGNTSVLVTGQPGLTGVTYPQFFTRPDGRLQLCLRVGSSGNGDWHLYEYSAAGWEYVGMLFGRGGGVYAPSGSSVRSAYPNQFRYDRNGRLHITWSWREANTNLNGNHDLGYACSDDFGRTWRNSAGDIMVALNGEALAENSIRHTTSGNIVYPIRFNWGYMNTTTEAVDSKGRVHVVSWRNPDDGVFANPVNLNDWRYFHYWRDTGGTWHERQLPFYGRKPQVVFDDAGNMYVIHGNAEDRRYHTVDPGWNLAVATATEASGWTDWQVVSGITERTYHGEPLLDVGRWERERILSVYAQEKPAIAGNGSPLRVLDFEPKSERVLWNEQQFGEAADDPLIAGDGQAPAGDGIVNLVKYAFGIPALSSDAAQRMPVSGEVQVEGDRYLTIRFERRTSPFSGVDYEVLGSEDLIEWSPVDMPGHLVGPPEDGGPGLERIVVRAPYPLSLLTRYFLRVQVSNIGP